MASGSPFAARTWRIAQNRTVELGPKAVIMGILNVTPDSFSDGGEHSAVEDAVRRGLRMVEEGAAIIDVGGESTRPGAAPVSADTEIARILPVIDQLALKTDAVISVDTYRAQTARAAMNAGAHVINDVWGCQREPEIADVAAETGAGLVLMHTGRGRTLQPDIVEDQFHFFKNSLTITDRAGIAHTRIVLDPGFGFFRTTDHDIPLLSRLDELIDMDFPLLVGTSRKRFLGQITGRDAADRGPATAATSVVARMKGAAIFRVHDIAMNRDALAVADALIEAKGTG